MVEIKGAAVGDAIKSVKARHGDQVYNTIVSQLQGEAQELFSQSAKILPTEWYPLDAFVQFLEVDLKLTANGNEEELIKRSEAVVEKQLKGIYKVFIQFGTPKFVLNRMSIVDRTYFRGVDVEVSLLESNKAIVKYTGFSKQHRLMGLLLTGFYKKALEISGAKNVTTKFATSIEEGKGYCELIIVWRG